MEREELEAKKTQLEKELGEWEEIRFYARERRLKDVKLKIKKIDKRIEAKKREDSGNLEVMKKRRKLAYPIEDAEWGVRNDVRMDKKDERRPPTLAGAEFFEYEV